MRKLLIASLALGLLVVSGAPVSAQITVPFVFVNATPANADEVNSDFAALATQALNRTGGTMTGTLTARNILTTHNTYDLATTAARFKDGYFAGTVYATTGFNGGALTLSGNATVGGTLGATGIATFTAAPVFSSGTASQTVELTAGKALTTVAFTGTGNYVKSASPTLTGSIGAAAMTLSDTLGVTGTSTLGAMTSSGASSLATGGGLVRLSTSWFVSNVAPTVLGSGYDNDVDNLDVYINYTGYHDGTTRSRNLAISDGKGTRIATFHNSGAVTFHALASGNLTSATGVITSSPGISATTGTFSSTLGVTGALTGTSGSFSTTLGVTGTSTLGVVNAGAVTSSGSVTGNGTGDHTFNGRLTVTHTTASVNSFRALNLSATGFGVYSQGGGGDAAHYMWQAADYAGNIWATVGGTGLLTVNGFGAHTFSTGGTGYNHIDITNTADGAGNGGYLSVNAATTTGIFSAYPVSYSPSGPYVASGVSLDGRGAGGLSIAATHASGVLRLYSGGTAPRWGVNAPGDWTFGASAHIADSSGTPTCGAGCTSIAGTDYAFTVNDPTAAGLIVSFGHTWTAAPVCTVTPTGANGKHAQTTVNAVSTTAIEVSALWSGSGGTGVNVLCRGY